MRCRHCYVDKKKDRLSLKDYFNLIDHLCANGLFMLYYTYGEPLMSDNLWEIIRYVNDRNIFQVLMTNGYALDINKARRLKEDGISSVCISIDSPYPKNHDANRGIKGGFAAAVKAIQNCRECMLNVGISSTVTESNAKELVGIVDIAKENDVGFVSFLRERRDGDIVPLTEDSNDAYISFFIDSLCSKSNAINIKFHDPSLIAVLNILYDKRKISDVEYEKYHGMNSCHAKGTISIESNGDIHYCNLNPCPQGNVLNKDISMILSERFAKNEDIICRSAISK